MKVIIFSAGEHLDIATAIKRNLDRYEFETRIWDEMIFRLSKGSLDSLMSELQGFDYAIAVVDWVSMLEDKGQNLKAPRDNVIFEIGLSMGALGADRTFLIHSNAVSPKLPTDLMGFTTARYYLKSNDADGHLSALRPRCDEIASEINLRGPKSLPFNLDVFSNRAELQKASKFDESLAKSTAFDLVTFSGQFLRDYKPELEKALQKGTKIRILAYDDKDETRLLYDALIISLQLGSGEDKRKEAKELREYIAQLKENYPKYADKIELRFIRNDLLLFNMWISRQENEKKVVHLTMYFHGRDAPSFRATGSDASLFETAEREFNHLWTNSVEIAD